MITLSRRVNDYIYRIKNSKLQKFAVQTLRHEIGTRPDMPGRPKYRVSDYHRDNIHLTINQLKSTIRNNTRK